MRANTLLWIAGGAIALLALAGGGVAVSEYIASEREKPYDATIKAAATKWGVPWQLLAAQLQQESDFNPDAVSSAGAQGIAQFMPETAAAYNLVNPFDPTESIDAQAHLMSDLYNQFGSWSAALAAYNWGPGNLQNALNTTGNNLTLALNSSPAETQNYVSKITSNAGVA